MRYVDLNFMVGGGGGFFFFFKLCYPPFSRMGGSYQGPVACIAEAEVIGTIFEEPRLP